MLCIGCAKHEAPPAPQGPKKPRVDIIVWLDREPEGDAETQVAVKTNAPPKEREMLERSGLHLAILGVPADVDPVTFLNKAIPEAEFAGSNATIALTTRCLADLQPALEKNVAAFWTLALVVGAACDARVKPAIGAAALVEAGKASRVRITFDRHTRAFLKVEPIP